VTTQEIQGIDNDVKSKFSQYNQTKSALQAAERKRTGNLATKSLVNVVSPSSLIQDSEYLDTHLVAVPNLNVKEFYKSYEELSPMVVPRSANKLAEDDEFNLFTVVTFKKHSADFVHKCREKRWTPREYKYKQGNKEEEAKETEQLTKDERKLWGEALRLGRTGYSESAMIWIHVLALRVFVETVLRYGLPLDFVAGIVQVSRPVSGCQRIPEDRAVANTCQTNAKAAKKAKANLDSAYSYLGGNAFGRDNKGRIKKDDSAMSADMQATGHSTDQEYTAYVYYEFEVV
jgi:V-type H+-transporting ATPase subunit C